MHIVYGLGNPGPSYRQHRHNAGRMLVDQLGNDLSMSLDRKRNGVRFGVGKHRGSAVSLAHPTTYINQSGTGYGTLLEFHDEDPEQAMVVLDDLDLAPGRVRLRPAGGDGGHRGLRSILSTIDSKRVPRLRIGIGRPPVNVSPADYVLQPFEDGERDVIDEALQTGISSVKTWIEDGITSAMNRYNS